jgi:hypothetical protein
MMNTIENSPVFTVSEIQDWWEDLGYALPINRMCASPTFKGYDWDIWIGWEDGGGKVIEKYYACLDESELGDVEAWFDNHMPHVHQYSR